MQTVVSIEIDRPIDEVFEFTTKHIAEWSDTVIEDEIIEEKPGVVGTTFRSITKDQGRPDCTMEFHGTVTRHEAPRVSAVSLIGEKFDIESEFVFEDLSGKTRVTQSAIVHGKGFMKVMLFLMGWLFRKSGCKSAQNELESLKRILESRSG